MLDLMEKATAFEAIITFHQAETLILSRIPQLVHTFPVKAPRGSGGASNPNIILLKQVLQEVYNYWVQKRSKLKRPLLRRFWPVTSTDDTNPHLVFRPREKEKYKLRKKRQNDMDAYLKLKQLRSDFDNLRVLLELVKRREELQRLHLHLQVDLFQQRLYDIIDTSGLPRCGSAVVRKQNMKRIWELPLHFGVAAGGRKAKRIRSSPPSSEALGGVPGTTGSASARSSSPFRESRTASSQDLQQKQHQAWQAQKLNVAGRNHGEPAPNFMHPLRTRESYVTSWEGVPPHFPTYENAHAQPTNVFRHRPRIGRGGRVCIDRWPLPLNEQVPPQTVLTAGLGMPLSQSEAKERLLDLLPHPIDSEAVSRKLQDQSLASLSKTFTPAASAVTATTADPNHPHGKAAAGDESDGEEVLVKLDDWVGTDDQLWGEERYAIGPV